MTALLLDGVPFTARDARAAGTSPKALRTLERRGLVRRLLRGVYVDGRVQVDLPLRAAALLAVVPDGCVVAGTTAAWLHGVPVLAPGAGQEPLDVEVLRPAGAAAVHRPGVAGRVAVLPPEDVVELGPLRVTTPSRTGLDLARRLDRADGLAYLDALLRAGLTDHGELEAGLTASSGSPWIDQARELVALADPRAESPGESWLRLRWHDAGLPPLELQVPVLEGGRVVFRLDAALPERRFAVEYDGEQWHGPERAVHDAVRRERLRLRHGWDVLAVGAGVVLGRSWDFERAVAERTGLVPDLLPHEWRRRSTWRTRRARAQRRAQVCGDQVSGGAQVCGGQGGACMITPGVGAASA